MPLGVSAPGPIVGETRLETGREAGLAAPGFAAAILAALEQIARGAGQRIVRLAEGIDAAVMVEIDAHVQPYLGHPLRVTHGAGPGADHLRRLRPAAIDDGQRVEQLGFPIGAPPRLAVGQRRERRDHRPHVFRIVDDVAERRLHAPEAEQHPAVDAVFLFDARQHACIFARAFFADVDAPLRDSAG